MKPGATVNLRNAKIDMFKGSMRVAVDKWGRVELTEAADLQNRLVQNLLYYAKKQMEMVYQNFTRICEVYLSFEYPCMLLVRFV